MLSVAQCRTVLHMIFFNCFREMRAADERERAKVARLLSGGYSQVGVHIHHISHYTVPDPDVCRLRPIDDMKLREKIKRQNNTSVLAADWDAFRGSNAADAIAITKHHTTTACASWLLLLLLVVQLRCNCLVLPLLPF